MEYNFKEIEKRRQEYWVKNGIYKVVEDENKPKYYVLDMFPYPSGAGLHVGHPLGYIASDIYSRYKRLKGFNVLHPMGYDAYGLPAEQYAIQTGQHPAITTQNNIARYREQLDKIGFSYDLSREIRTCDPGYYKWTQWAFIQMFHHFYNYNLQKAEPIEKLINHFRTYGTDNLNAACGEELSFTAKEWNEKSEKEKQRILLNYRIAYLGDTPVNWCPGLGTVLANDEVSEGLSVRGGYPVEQKIMRQWCLRVSAYAQRLLDGLEQIDWTESLKDTQRHWIGRSDGAEIRFKIVNPGAPDDKDIPETSDDFKSNAGNENLIPGYYIGDKNLWMKLVETARSVKPSKAQHVLWDAFLMHRIGHDVKRNQPVAFFTADFVFPLKRLIVEVVPENSETAEYKQYLKERHTFLSRHDFKVLRFEESEIFSDAEPIIHQIKQQLNSIPSFEKMSELISDNAESEEAPLPSADVDSAGQKDDFFTVFTTRADTIFGVTFMVLAPESELVEKLTTPEQEEKVKLYLEATKKRTERERIADKKVTGVFSGSYAVNPFNNEKIPVWISDYVLAGYGTGAIMAVPAHDSRDHAFAKHFDLPIIPLIEGCDVSEESFDAKDGIMINSGFLNGLTVKEAIPAAIEAVEKRQLGKRRINYRLRDAIFSRQRYWGEPFPIYYKDDLPYTVEEKDLPLQLPEIDKFLPTETGEPPLGRAKDWTYNGYPLELSTMPGFAGSSAYYLRYMDPQNENALVREGANEYWRNVDLYIGGTEHATGHLIYSRFWNKFLYDLGVVCEGEPFKKLVNQGMIQGRSNFVYRIQGANLFVSYNLKAQYDVTPIHVDVNMVDNDVLDTEKFKAWNPEYRNAEFILENGKYICGYAVEKMSKSMFNVVNPDDVVEKYGADTLRMYEMFLGPLEISKPWDTNGIDGVYRFLRKLWNLFYNEDQLSVSEEIPTQPELKSLHKLIKKVSSDIENFSFNTSVSAFMICVNELTALKCNKKAILNELLILIAPFAPHVAEELWHTIGNDTTICDAKWPDWNEDYLTEDSFTYSISFNGKTRFTLDFPADARKKEIEKTVLEHENSQKWLAGEKPKKVIIVPKKIVNIVV